MEHVDKLLIKVMAAGLCFGMAHGVLANEDKITKGFYSMDAMGCMLLKECTNGVERINSSIDLMNAYPDANWDYVKDEFDQIMIAFKKIGVHVHLADERYFPHSHRGVYHTCLLYTSPSPRDQRGSRMPSSA